MQKIIFIGLDGSGKTSVYQRFFGKKTPAELSTIIPTRGIAKYEHDFLRSDVEIIELGGGKQFRQGYIGNKELAGNLSAIVYFIDVQNVAIYQEAANYLITWTKSVADLLKGVKGYILFHKIDPGTEARVKSGLQQIAGFIAPLGSIFPGELVKSITSIHNDSSNELIQRILLDTLPKKMSKPRVEVVQEEPEIVTPPVKQPMKEVKTADSYITKAIETRPPAITSPPVKQPTTPTSTTTIKSPTITPPKLDVSPTTTPSIVPPSSDISQPMKKEQLDDIKIKTAERLSDIIEASLDSNHEFIAIAVYTENVERLVGAVQQGENPQILQLIEATLHKIDLEEYMSRIGKVKIGGEGHLTIDKYNIFFERVSPEHLSTIITSSVEEDTIKNIQQLNRYLNQALSVTPDGATSDSYKRADLIAELKMRLYNRGKSVDHVG